MGIKSIKNVCVHGKSEYLYFGLKSSERKQKDGYQIYVSSVESFERFKEIIEPYVLDSMRYKIPIDRITIMPK